MISKPYFNDSELYCILDAVKSYKKNCEKMYETQTDCDDEKQEVLEEMDDIVAKIKKYIEENTIVSNAITKLLYTT